MHELMNFKHSEFGHIRALKIKQNPWFVGIDVASALGYVNTRGALIDHCKYAKMVGRSETLPLDPQTKIIPEADVYRLIFRSKLPAAEKFQDWVCEDVLPSIRKHGFYEHKAGAKKPTKDRKITQNMVKTIAMSNPKIRGQIALRALQAYTDIPVDDLLEQQEMYDAEPSSLRSAEVQRFVAENCSFGEDLTENATALYHSYLAWAPRKPGPEQISQKKFGTTLSQFYPKVKRGGLYVYLGLELKNHR